MNKREMAEYVKKQIAGLVAAMDLDQLLGTEVYESLCADSEMMAYAELQQKLIAKRIEG